MPELTYQTGHGLDVATTRHTLPANLVFPPAELADRITAHAKRVAADEAKLPPRQPHGTGHTKRAAYQKRRTVEGALVTAKRALLPDGRHLDDLKLVSCANCCRPLLGPSEEVHRYELSKRSKRVLPQSVCGVDRYGSPLCGRCDERHGRRAGRG